MVNKNLMALAVFAVVAPFTIGTASAQDPSVPRAATDANPTNVAPPAVMPGSPAPAMTATSAKADAVSRRFITGAIQGNFAEIALGKLAETKSSNDAVKAYGTMLVTDHSQANDKAMEAARVAGVKAPTGPNAEQRRMYNRMTRLSGNQFDTQFIKHMVADHKKDVRDYQRHASVKAAPIAAYAKESVPTLQKHLDQAMELSRSQSSRQSS